MTAEDFLAGYDARVSALAHDLRVLVMQYLPGVTEQVDVPAKMIAYAYGPKYAELVCVIIPSKQGLKLGFNRGTALPDPAHLLEGTGKVSRYVPINDAARLSSADLADLLKAAYQAYLQRVE